MNQNQSNYRKIFYSSYRSKKILPNYGNSDDKDFRNWSLFIRKKINEWLPPNKNISILDIGCGSGNLLRLFREMGYTSLWGIDISSEQVDEAKLKIPDAIIKNGDIIDFLGINNEKYDLICAFDLFGHMKKDERIELLELIKKSLLPSGLIIIQAPNGTSPWFGVVGYGDFTMRAL